jgi:hypothetical protein
VGNIPFDLLLVSVIGIVPIGIGFLAAFRPQMMSKNFGVEVSGPSTAFVRCTGIRDIFLGIAILVPILWQDRDQLLVILLATGLVAVGDFMIVRAAGDKNKSWIHFISALAIFIFAGYLGWIR